MTVFWQRYLQSMQNNLQSVKNRTTNAVNSLLNPMNTRFHPYIGRRIFDRRKITSKVLKNTANAVKQFKSQRIHVYAHIQATIHPIDKKNLQSAKKRTANVVKPVLKPANTSLWQYLRNTTSDRHKKPFEEVKKERRMHKNRFQRR